MLRSKILGLGLGLVGLAVATSANAAPINFNGLGLNGSGAGASWSVIHKSNTQNAMSGTTWQKLEAPNINNLPLNYTINGATSLDGTGGLDGATLDFAQSDLQFEYKNGANTNEDLVLRILGGSLNITHMPGAFPSVQTAPQFGFGNAAPQYGLTGNINFELRNAFGAVMTSTFELLANPDLNAGPFNGLAVGDNSNGLPTNDVIFFVWAGSNSTTDYFTPGTQKFIGIDLAGWGTPVQVPAPAGLLLLGFGLAGLIATRRKAA